MPNNPPVHQPRQLEPSQRSVPRRALALFYEHKPKLVLFFVLTILSSSLALIPVLLIKRIVNVITPAADGSVGETSTLFMLVGLAVARKSVV